MSKLNVKVKTLTHERSVIEVETRGGSKEIFIDKTCFGHAWDDFAGFDISDENYYDLEKLVDDVKERMDGVESSLNVEWDYKKETNQ